MVKTSIQPTIGQEPSQASLERLIELYSPSIEDLEVLHRLFPATVDELIREDIVGLVSRALDIGAFGFRDLIGMDQPLVHELLHTRYIDGLFDGHITIDQIREMNVQQLRDFDLTENDDTQRTNSRISRLG